MSNFDECKVCGATLTGFTTLFCPNECPSTGPSLPALKLERELLFSVPFFHSDGPTEWTNWYSDGTHDTTFS